MLFKKKKLDDGAREIYFCGLKIFKYIKKTNNPVINARHIGVKIGKNTRIVSSPNWGSEPFLIEIGDNVLISFDCCFVTHDGCISVCQNFYEETIFKFGRIKVGNNCFIGCRSTILPGVNIGNNSIVGACSVVTKNIPDGEVWAGNPAKFICKTIDLAEKIRINCTTPYQIELYNYVKQTQEKNKKSYI